MQDRILVVDDEEHFVTAISRRLAARGFTVDVAHSGSEAVDHFHARTFDVVILDLAMPGMDGLETLEQLLKIDPLAQVVLLTGHGSISAATSAMKGGAAEFIEKPADFDELMDTLRRCVARRLELDEKVQSDQIAEILRTRGW